MPAQVVNSGETAGDESARLRQSEVHVRVAKAWKQHSRKTDCGGNRGIRYCSDAVGADTNCCWTVPFTQPVAIDGVIDGEGGVGCGFRSRV